MEDEQHGYLAFQSHYGMSIPYALGRTPPALLRPFKLPFLHQQGRR